MQTILLTVWGPKREVKLQSCDEQFHDMFKCPLFLQLVDYVRSMQDSNQRVLYVCAGGGTPNNVLDPSLFQGQPTLLLMLSHREAFHQHKQSLVLTNLLTLA